jgi:hypothetical protein
MRNIETWATGARDKKLTVSLTGQTAGEVDADGLILYISLQRKLLYQQTTHTMAN